MGIFTAIVAFLTALLALPEFANLLALFGPGVAG